MEAPLDSSITLLQQEEIDRQAYNLAREYLFGLNIPGLTREIIESYGKPASPARPSSLAQIYLQFLTTAQNANMKAGVVGGAIGGVENLGVILCDFDPVAVVEKYGTAADRLLDDITNQLRPNGEIRRTPRSIWPQYCGSALSGAQFFSQFGSADAFYEWADSFNRQDEWCAALPLLLEKEVTGLGFALACDFLKELGYVNFAKPDVHLSDIFKKLSLCDSDADGYGVFKAILRVARHCGVSPYEVDKMFWLTGSGYFYNHTTIGRKGKINIDRQTFVDFARSRMKT